MLLGLPFTANGALGDSSQKLRTTFYAGYIQDDWRVTPNLSLNLGLRYEFSASPTGDCFGLARNSTFGESWRSVTIPRQEPLNG